MIFDVLEIIAFACRYIYIVVFSSVVCWLFGWSTRPLKEMKLAGPFSWEMMADVPIGGLHGDDPGLL